MEKRAKILSLLMFLIILALFYNLSQQTEPEAEESEQVFSREMSEAELIDAFGVEVSESIASGFVFLDGCYLDAPYEVSRKGISVYINDKVCFTAFLPEKAANPVVLDVDPELPVSITKDTSIYDKALVEWMGKKIAYVQKHHTREEEIKIMEEAYRNLPFVKSAYVDPEKPHLIYLTTYKGDATAPWALASFRRKGKFDHDSILKRVNGKFESYKNNLAVGNCLFLYTRGGHLTIKSRDVRTKLPGIVAILRSEKSDAEKFAEIKKAGMDKVHPNEPFGLLATQFSASAQLEERLAKLAIEDQVEGE